MKKDNNCEICKNNIPFKMPNEIIKAAINNNLVLFVGSGISTESKSVYPFTFYEEIASELDYNIRSIDLSFPELMSKYCEKPNGKKELLKKIKYRIDYVKSFQSLYNTAVRFYTELSSIYLIKEIFTTNWDDFFETECGAIPFVTSDDLAFWDIPKRRVFKIHGSINNIGSIVATMEDYKKCYEGLKSHFIGNYLKVTLSTKLVVFIGYSFRDEDFNRLYSLFKDELGRLMPHSYIVTLDKDTGNKFDSSLITPIVTDGTYFIHTLKNKLIKEKILMKDSIDLYADLLLEVINDIHYNVMPELKISEYPNVLYTYVYQDGIIDALQRFKKLKCTGDYHNRCNYHKWLYKYDEIRKKKIHIKKYTDVAYIDGYMNGLTIFLIDNIKELESFPYYYIYGLKKDIKNFAEYKSIIKSNKIFHKSAYNHAVALISKMKISGGNKVYQHTPFLY
ncbi:MAG: SIR2 family protein [Actinobacteria bacterium]|nr:SIR2 family protein [Actinomycetota bacterium]